MGIEGGFTGFSFIPFNSYFNLLWCHFMKFIENDEQSLPEDKTRCEEFPLLLQLELIYNLVLVVMSEKYQLVLCISTPRYIYSWLINSHNSNLHVELNFIF